MQATAYKPTRATTGELRLLNVLLHAPRHAQNIDSNTLPNIGPIVRAIQKLYRLDIPVTLETVYQETPSLFTYQALSDSTDHFTTTPQIKWVLELVEFEKKKDLFENLKYELVSCSDVVAGIRLIREGLELLTGCEVEA